MEIVLTDDEVVAVAVQHKQAWPAALATVDVDEAEALRGAAFRGQRSLAVRGLVGDGSAPDPMLDAIKQRVLGSPAHLLVFTGAADGTRAADAINVNAFPTGDQWIVDTVSAIGVHQFSVRTSAELAALCTGLADAAYARGFDEGSSSESLWLAVSGDRPGAAVRVRRGEIALSGFEGIDSTAAGSSTAAEAVTRVLQSARAAAEAPGAP